MDYMGKSIWENCTVKNCIFQCMYILPQKNEATDRE